ncbi:Qat anti-phage system associated protein QatB [Candidatus Palauibacter irciniicola]|uniref:Qat anti-phage system associated protein QatB n=1 Tax=Candidatus Palauibacter irciniicola TaxID=3056733 RepID=UPI003B020127
MTRGARTSDSRAIRRGAARYVGASGGGRAAARRMPNSRAVASGVAELARSFASHGPVEALRRFDLDGMAGAPAEDVFVALTDMLCPPGGTIDEAIARDAMLEAVADLAAAGVGDFDELSTDDLRELFIGVVSRSIEGKILNEVGTNAVSVPADIAGVERAQNMLRDFVEGCVRDEFEARGSELGDLDGNVIDGFVEDLYAAALGLVMVLGDDR